MNWIQGIQTGIALAASILGVLQQVEQLLGAKKGQDKKALATSVITNGLAVGAAVSGASAEQTAAIVQTVPAAIDASVAALNAAGIFKQSPAADEPQ